MQVKGKPNAITIDSFKKVGLIFDKCLSQVEIIESESFRIKCTDKAPAIKVDCCDSVTYFLNEGSLLFNSSAINFVRQNPKDSYGIIETCHIRYYF